MKHLTEKQRIEIVKIYISENIRCSELAKRFGVSPTSITKLLHKRGIKVLNNQSVLKRKYSLNQHYFDIIDTEAKAYFLGLLYADGCNHEPLHVVSISLQEQDAYILEVFKKELETNKPIQAYSRQKEHPTYKILHKLGLSTLIMSRALARLGCVQNKTYLMKFPTKEQVPDHLLHHFMRGMFDGDGCFCITSDINEYKHYYITIASTEDFCIGLKKFIDNNLFIVSRITKYKKRENNIRKFDISGRLNMCAFGDWIYQDATIYLERKYQKYLEAKNQKPRRPYRLKKTCQIINYKKPD